MEQGHINLALTKSLNPTSFTRICSSIYIYIYYTDVMGAWQVCLKNFRTWFLIYSSCNSSSLDLSFCQEWRIYLEIGVKQPPAILLMFLATPLLPFCWSFRTSTTLTLSFCLVPYWLERFHRHIAEDLTESSLEFASTKAIFFI